MATAKKPASTASKPRTTKPRTTTKASAAKATAAAKPVAPPEATMRLIELDNEAQNELDGGRKPFTLDLGDGKPPVTLEHPGHVELKTIIGNNPGEVVAEAMDPIEFTRLIESGINGLQFTALVVAWREYYGVGTEGE